MKYFIPNYVLETYVESGLIITNLLNGAIIELSQQEAQDYKKIKSCGADAIETYITKTLMEEEFLVDANKQADLYKECLNLMNSILYLTIMPTEGCNFRCIYCYEKHAPISMDSSIISGIKKFVSDLIEKHFFSSIRISWFGGEPLLKTDVIKDFMGFIHNESKPNTPISSFVTTNGYLLDAKTLIELYSVGVSSFHITLDGREHDRKRPLSNGEGTIDIILQNLKEIHSLPPSIEYEIILRNNILAGDQDFTWYDYLKKMFGTDKRFKFSVVTVGKLGGVNDDQFQVEEDHELEKEHLKYLERIGLTTVPMVNHYALSGVCSAAYRFGYLFRADGRIGKCTIDLDDPLNQIGMINENGYEIYNEIEEKWYKDTFDAICSSCPDGLICLNRNCPIKRMKNNDTHLCIRV